MPSAFVLCKSVRQRKQQMSLEWLGNNRLMQLYHTVFTFHFFPESGQFLHKSFYVAKTCCAFFSFFYSAWKYHFRINLVKSWNQLSRVNREDTFIKSVLIGQGKKNAASWLFRSTFHPECFLFYKICWRFDVFKINRRPCLSISLGLKRSQELHHAAVKYVS